MLRCIISGETKIVDGGVFEDYYGYVKTEIRNGSNFNYVHTFWSEVIV